MVELMAPKKLILILLIFVSFCKSKCAIRVESACELAPDRKFCESSLYANSASSQSGPKQMSETAIKKSIAEATRIRHLIPNISGDSQQSRAIQDCSQLYDLAVDHLTDGLSELSQSSVKLRQAVDVQSFLSAALTYQVTCLDGLKEAKVNLRSYSFPDRISNCSRSVSSCLALVRKYWIGGTGSVKASVNNRRLLSDTRRVRRVDDGFLSQYGSMGNGFPSWLSRGDRRLLLQTARGVSLTGNVVTVAQNGSGNFTTITDAINAASNKSADRFVIYVTGGVYEEYVAIPKSKYNIMLIGDGINVTVITGNRSVVDGWTTFNSATLSTVGKGFIARDLTIENTAGAVKHQAVALRVGADLSVFYHCSFKGYQDTLYTHSLRQFYRECEIYGTVDFIFGNSAVVFQDCTLLARKPMDNQQNLFTAQGRTDPNQNTGISIQNCNVTAESDLVPVISSFPTYLGRPWKEYSRTVYMQSYLDSLIQPAGWLAWSGDFALSTLYYGEYDNNGPGAGTSLRVTWAGYNVMNSTDAQNFTVTSFISGDSWLPATSVTYNGGLS
ncbi:pectinesterase [Cryptomeria japonica]|uniref:pectinesterase n=1 Tax=Cryptomeria japonica TaxID=3369 RepID=UPI0025AD00F3|nr:pectinesterase [Cryptomeria japonica]